MLDTSLVCVLCKASDPVCSYRITDGVMSACLQGAAAEPDVPGDAEGARRLQRGLHPELRPGEQRARVMNVSRWCPSQEPVASCRIF